MVSTPWKNSSHPSLVSIGKGPAPTFESADGQYSLTISGRVHADFAVYDQDPVATGAQDARVDPDLNSGSLIRRGRLGVEGKIAGDWVYELFLDLGSANSRLYSAYMAYKGIKPLTIAIGKHKAPTGMEEMTSSNDITFLERSLPSNVATDVGASRRLGLSVQANGDAWYAGVGVFGTDDNVEVMDEQIGVNGRVAVVPWRNDDALIHVGASGYYLFMPDQNNAANEFNFTDRPEIRVDGTRWISGASPAIFSNDNAWLYAAELAGKYGPFWTQAEYFGFGMNQSRDPAGDGTGEPDLDFEGFYAQAGYILTGESRNYVNTRKTFGTVTPANPFSLSAGGWGAWELAVRFSYVDLDDHANSFDPTTGLLVGSRGGVEQNWTAAVNWYVNNYVLFKFNYINVDVDRLSAAGLQSGDNFDVYALRAQVKW